MEMSVRVKLENKAYEDTAKSFVGENETREDLIKSGGKETSEDTAVHDDETQSHDDVNIVKSVEINAEGNIADDHSLLVLKSDDKKSIISITQPEIFLKCENLSNTAAVKLEGECVGLHIEAKTASDEEEISDADALIKEKSNEYFCLDPRETGFTSEKFKIEISGLPRRYGFKELRKRLSSTLGLRPHKLKAVPRTCFAFVCFSCEEDREAALRVINGHVWKGRELHAKKAQPVTDPMKRKQDESADTPDKAKKLKLDESLPASTRLKYSVTPLWEIPYENQLQMKVDRMKEILKSVASHADVRDQFMKARKENSGMCCPLLPITPCPLRENYRNKSEFSVGHNEDGTETVVGFRFGLYKDGTDCVGSPSEISIISSHSKVVVQCFQQYVCSSRYEPFNHRTHRGHWRQLTVRTTCSNGGGTMAIVEFVVNNTTLEEQEAEKDAIKKYFLEGLGHAAGITSFFFRPCSSQTSNSTSEEPYELIFGDGYITESMMGMKFRISPSAFFQVNTAAAEVLYKLIADWSKVSPNTTILDLCCGTGTIGLSMAKNVSQVIGIEMCKEAVEDAQVNAELNGISNCKYYCAKVQDVIHDITQNLASTDVVAILDPPRAGIHPTVIKALRLCSSVKRIVYASCHPAIAKVNFIDLVRPSSRKNKGAPFQFVQAMPMDMFPHTNFCELLVLFERDDS